MAELTPLFWIYATAVAMIAGVVKGAVGFAMPMILISGLGSVLPPELALAGLILPTLASNVWQSLRGGIADMVAAVSGHWLYIGIVMVMIMISAQLVRVISQNAMFLIIGVPVVALCAIQLLGWRPRLSHAARRPFEVATALVAGFVGGLSGVWGPPTVIYLTALETPKYQHVAVQGVAYGLGSVVLLGAHLRSGVFNAETAVFSAILCVPAMLGLVIGFRLLDRLDQDRFRRVTLVVLGVVGLNLIRRGLMG